jgi:hypothetical protein
VLTCSQPGTPAHSVQAAWKELERPSVSPEDSGSGEPSTSGRKVAAAPMATPRPKGGHAREMAHALHNLAGVEADTAAESTINKEMAGLLLARLRTGHTALSASHKFVQSLAAAEAAMAGALVATRGAALGCESDGAVLHRVHATVTVLPSSLAAAHARRERGLRAMALTLADAAAMFDSSRGTLERGAADVVDMMRQRRERLRAALRRHEAACADVDRSDALRVRGAGA